MEHQITIFNGNAACHEVVHLMARIELGPFEDDGFPETVRGTLIEPEDLPRSAGTEPDTLVELGGRTYRFSSVEDGGAFELRKDHDVETVAFEYEDPPVPDPPEDIP